MTFLSHPGRRRRVAPAMLAWLLALAIAAPGRAADGRGGDIATLERAVEELRAQNRALAERLATLEGGAAGGATAPAAGPARPPGEDTEALARRVRELEIANIAQQDATRAIIRDSLSTLGSKINESVSLGGALEVQATHGRDFSGSTQSEVQLSTAELDLEIQAGPWARARLVVARERGTDTLFRDTRGFESGVDRFALDTASVTLGDVQRFPLVLHAGRITLGFGSSTGVHRSDVLSIESPLTTDAFETRRNAIGIGFGWPTPPLAPERPPVIVPPVRPLVLAPLVEGLARRFGYAPPPSRPPRPVPVSLPAEPPPYYGAVYLYDGTGNGLGRRTSRNLNARLGMRAGGHCGRPYGELRAADLCPWSLDFNVDYLHSVFDSRFLESGYRAFADQFGPVHGLASTLKLTMGPWLFVGEWNGAIGRAVFQDDAGRIHRIRPSAWQLSLGYQFDWNPWVEAIGGQGTFVAAGYSRTTDLAGAIEQAPGGEPSRVGNLPRERWTLTAGEWVAEGLKVQLEYAHIKDYAVPQGGTGAGGHGLQLMLTYVW